MTELEEMVKVRDLAGKCVLLLQELESAGDTKFYKDNEDLEVTLDLVRARNKVDNRKATIRGITTGPTWPKN